ncbi:MAG: ABC transporter permease [Streptosporangiales bacterium]
MSSTVAEVKVDPDAITSELGESGVAKWAKLSIQPALVIIFVLGFVIWRATATLDSIERRSLAWARVGELLWQHIALSVVSTVIVLAVAMPLGILLTRRSTRKATPAVVGVANIGQAAPAVGLLVLFALWLGIGFWTTIIALCLYAILPVLRNTIVGLDQVDQRLVEAGRGMGMTAAAVLWRIELPLAVPVILAGARTALVLLVGTATLATLVGAGGLGELVNTGIKLTRTSVLVSGALLVAALALIIDWLGRVAEEIAKPKGI